MSVHGSVFNKPTVHRVVRFLWHIQNVGPKTWDFCWDLRSNTWNPFRSWDLRPGTIKMGPKIWDLGPLWYMWSKTREPEGGTQDPYDKWQPIPRTLISSWNWDQKELWSKWSMIEYLRNRIWVLNRSDLQS